MKHLRRWFAVCLLALPLGGHAYENPALLEDYIGLTKLLKANGVEPATIQWQTIELMCLGLKEPNSNLAYNQCRYEKAVDQALYRNDSDACDAEARAAYPSSLSNPRSTVISSNTTGATTERTTATIKPPRVAGSTVRYSRRALFNRCMRDQGWINTGNWQMGREKY